jgi:hypothetical protein
MSDPTQSNNPIAYWSAECRRLQGKIDELTEREAAMVAAMSNICTVYANLSYFGMSELSEAIEQVSKALALVGAKERAT